MNNEIELKNQIIEIMQQESDLLDVILSQQSVVHKSVSKRNWENIESVMSNLQDLSDKFVELESKRVLLCNQVNIFQDPELSPVIRNVRTKLNKSKVENRVLNEYISTTRKFLQGIFDEVIPQRRNILYSKNGNVIKPELSSVVLNQFI